MTNPAEIAKRLTPGQRKALAYLASIRHWSHASRTTFSAKAGNGLSYKGLAIKTLRHPRCVYEATDLGRAVAAKLEE